MPSPFPGMDPYLEGSEWASIHIELSSEIARHLDVTLDLQLALNTIYDALSYDLSVDYTRPPEVPLEGELAAWAAERLRAAGSLANDKE